jgi:hypothetical protein
MKKIFMIILLIGIGLMSCQNETIIETPLSGEEQMLADLEISHGSIAFKKPMQNKPIFLRKAKAASISGNFLLDGLTDPQEIYISPTLNNLNPFFITLWSEYGQCFHVIDYIPATNPITVLAQTEDILLLKVERVEPGLTDYWTFWINENDQLEWGFESYQDGELVEETKWSITATASEINLQTVVYCPGESASE